MFSNVAKTSKYEICSYKDSLWLKVFFHNHSTKVSFANESEALHTNSEFKYSILDEINPSMRISSKYEFIMEFPDDLVFIHWTQHKNPVHELDGKAQSDGFKMIEHNMPSVVKNFSGLTRSTIKVNGLISCFLDGNPSDFYWYFAVGMYQNADKDFTTKGIPTYKEYTTSLRLWINCLLS